MKESIEQLDEVIHQKVRLGLMTILAGRESADFGALRDQLGLTDGNLSSHLSQLEKRHYIRVDKTFVSRKPRTTVTITKKGKEALHRYVDLLRRILDE